jgi:Lipocalin-like domain
MAALNAEQLIGTWRLAHWVIDYEDGRRTVPFGDDAQGLLIYAADGGMSATMQRKQRTSLDASAPARASLATRAAIVEEYLAYCGTWALEDGVIVHRVLYAANPVLMQTEQRREAQLIDDCLTLSARESEPAGRIHTIAWLRGAHGRLDVRG